MKRKNRIFAYQSLEHADKFNSRVLEVLKTPVRSPEIAMLLVEDRWNAFA
jgi:hypothetical protein